MIRKEFDYVSPTPEGLDNIRQLRLVFSDVAEAVERLVPPSRGRALALTKLEEAAAWAIKAVAHESAEDADG
jgi:hypothetical protein